MSRLSARCYRSIYEIAEVAWDSILTPDDLFHTHRFLRTVEDARVEDSKFWYLLFYEEMEVAGSAVLSAFRVPLDIFLEGRAKNLIQRVRRRFPHFMAPCILFCGSPVSLGQHHLVICREQSANRILEQLSREMDRIGREEGVRYQCIKEFKESQLQQVSALENYGFFKGYSIPYLAMEISWDTFSDYLSSLRAHYRRLIRRSICKIQFRPDTAHISKRDDQCMPKAELKFNNWEACPPALFHKLYLKVMERATTKLETLNLAFFEQCWKNRTENDWLISLEADGDILCAGLLFHHGDTLTFALIGKEKEKAPESDPYFNLVYGIIDLACRLQCQRLNLGQTAYWVKQRVGGQPEDVYLFFKAKNPLIHYWLKALRHHLFPPYLLKKINPIREKAIAPVQRSGQSAGRKNREK